MRKSYIGSQGFFAFAYAVLMSIVLAGLLGTSVPAAAEQPSVIPAATVYKCKASSGGYAYQGMPCSGKSKGVSSWMTPAFAEAARVPVSANMALQQSSDGAYRVAGSANAIPLTFLVDTGATFLSLPKEVADKAGMHCVKAITTNTANGSASGCEAIISKLTFGRFTVRDVRAVIMPNLAQPLLGMNVLSQFKVEHEDGTMKISMATVR